MESTDKPCGYISAFVTGSEETDLTDLADEIEQEIAERYMLLPVDAEGVPIHVGDKMEREGQQFIVCAVAPAVIHSWAAWRKLGEGLTTVGYRPEDCRHYKPRTIEDVLTDFAYKVCDMNNIADTEIKRYAVELRELMGVRDE